MNRVMSKYELIVFHFFFSKGNVPMKNTFDITYPNNFRYTNLVLLVQYVVKSQAKAPMFFFTTST